MKVLFCIRNDYLRNFAGDSMQALMTADYLRRKGVKVEINSGDISDYSSYDIIHLFNLTRMGETYKYYKIAKHYKKNVVLSPVYWNLKKYFRFAKDFESIRLWDKCKIYREEILKGCRVVYPNSSIEAEMLKGEFGYWIPCKIVYNGVNNENEGLPLYNFIDRYNLDNYILCVGRICHRKNQLTLAEICEELDLKLVLIGNINDKKYYNECMKHKNVSYLGFMDGYNIYNAYRFARLHVLPSFVETPGLSSLEAAAAGCTIVSTMEGSAEEYFNDMATFCNPYDKESIKRSIEKAYKKGKNEILKKHVLDNFTWDNCLEELYKSYLALL